tara:strand:- start:1177 stop:2400 length:1224 start_codon:yes stop_codon:yes gene_type:complete
MTFDNFTNNTPHSLKNDEGFSLIELSVVVFVLGILGSLSIGNISKWTKFSKIDEASSILSSSLIECLELSRGGKDPTSVGPINVISNEILESSGYKIKTSKDKCSEFFITPKNSEEKVLFEMGYQITADNQVTKIATPADNESSLIRCKRWAGSNCGASEEQKAAWAAAASLAARKKECNDNFFNWLNGPPPGTTSENFPKYSWNSEQKDCNLRRYAFEGSLFGSQDDVDEAFKKKLGAVCDAKVVSQKNLNPPTDGVVSNFTECPGQIFYFCNGEALANEADMKSCQNKNKAKKCENARDSKAQSNYSGKWGPNEHKLIGPEPCGTTYWMCGGNYTTNESDYKTWSCFSPGGGGGKQKPKTAEECIAEQGSTNKQQSTRNFCTCNVCSGQIPKHPYCGKFYRCLKP